MGVGVYGWAWGAVVAVVMVLLIHPQPTQQLPDIISIGGLFDKGDLKQEEAFRYAVASINRHKMLGRTRLRPIIEKISPYDSFHASRRVCHLVRSGVAAIFGPQSGQTSTHVQSICDAMEIPHIETRWDYRLKRDEYSVNLYPHPSWLSKAYLDLVHLFEWRTFSIVYENNEGLVRLQELIKTPLNGEFQVTIMQLPPGDNYRDLLWTLFDASQENIIVDCSPEKMGRVLKQAQQIGMMTPHHKYILSSLDTHIVDLEDFKYCGANITAMRLLDPDNEDVKRILMEWQSYTNTPYEHPRVMKPSPFNQRAEDRGDVTTEMALMYDAVSLFVHAMKDLDSSTTVTFTPLMCDGEDAWIHGYSLSNIMKVQKSLAGLTGPIWFDSRGFRTGFVLDIVQLGMKGLAKVGSWSLNKGINYTYSTNHTVQRPTADLKNKKLIVSFTFTDPYIMYKDSKEQLKGNARYEGFCVDLLDEIADRLKFQYELVISPDGSTGGKRANGSWSGMIGELLAGRSDMAITDLTITHERKEAVDFTLPWMNLGISILYVKPQKIPPLLFSFLSPLSLEVWMYMMSAYIGVSFIMYIMARLTPYEWQSPHPCDPDPEELENQFTVLNCLWFSIGSLMQQGCDFLPQAVSTRMVAGMWWFFTLIMISSYTANLAAFLTVERLETIIESADDLAYQQKIKYGCTVGGSSRGFFKNSNYTIYKEMSKFMEQNTDVFVLSNEAGVKRVQRENGKYAFLMESTSIEYVTERNCDLTQVGGLLDSKGYGIALPPGSPYKGALDESILSLQEEARLHILKEKWFKQKKGGGKCKAEATASGGASELNLQNVGGVFLVLMCGMSLALVVAIGEFLIETWRLARDDQLSFRQVLTQELRFVFKCKGSSKAVRKKSSECDENEETSNNIYGSDVYNYTGKNSLT